MTLLVLGGCWGGPPSTLGPRGDTLAPCPSSPNCVHTGMRHPEGTEGIFLRTDLSTDAVMEQLRGIIESMTRTTVVSATERYLHAEARSLIFRFVDDFELLLLPTRELVVRSASRVGRSDLGVNAKRVEQLRGRLEDAGLLRR